MGHDEMLQVLKEKMRLEGQLESLSSEANQVIKRSNFSHTNPLESSRHNNCSNQPIQNPLYANPCQMKE